MKRKTYKSRNNMKKEDQEILDEMMNLIISKMRAEVYKTYLPPMINLCQTNIDKKTEVPPES